MREKHPFGFYSFIFVFSLGIFSIGTLISREQSLSLSIAYASTFLSYLFLFQEKNSFKTLLGIGLVSRLLLFFSLPSLSDDVYRFIWDGTLLANGIHPFDQLPNFYLDKQVPGINSELFEKLNSKEYFTVYPPINQFIFWLSAVVGNGSWLASTNVIRSVLFAADVGTFWVLVLLLKRYQKPVHLAFLYFLNPLILLEFVGNAHFDGLMLFFVLLGIYGLEATKKFQSGVAFGFAIGIKLLPFIYLPFVFLAGLKNKKWIVAIIGTGVGLLTLLPMLSASFLEGMQSSLNLYFQKFEFNASLYFLAREIGYWFYGYNNIALIGPLLSILSFIAIIIVSVLGAIRNWSLPKAFLFILFIYLLFATTVHPWYTLPLIAFGILSGYYFPIVWSLMIFVTYSGYSEARFELPIWLVILEYSVVLLALVLELKNRKLMVNQI